MGTLRRRAVRNHRQTEIDPETGPSRIDKNNPDPAHRGRPLIGAPVLYGSA
jgi:hypothetical protein